MDSFQSMSHALPIEQQQPLPPVVSNLGLIQQVTCTILPNKNVRIDQCYACHQLILPGQDFIYVVAVDPSQDYQLDMKHLSDELNYIAMPDTETMIIKNRELRPYHVSASCYKQLPFQLASSSMNRVLIHPLIVDRELKEGRMTIQDHKASFHKSKLYITSTYPDVELLTVQAVSNDTVYKESVPHPNPLRVQEPYIHTSMVLHMPYIVSKVLHLQAPAWPESQMYGLFQRMSIFDVTLTNQMTIPAQLNQLTQLIKSQFESVGVKQGIQGCIYAFRNTNTESTNEKQTTWRLIVRLEYTMETFRALVADFFHYHFLNPDANHPHIMTWEQVFHNDVLEYVNLDRFIQSKQAGFEPSQATVSITRLRQEWIKRRNQTQNQLLVFIDTLKQTIDKSSKLVMNPGLIKEIHSYWINEMEYNEQVFEYRMNSQRVSANNNDSQLYYTQSLHTPSIQSLFCWKQTQTHTTQDMNPIYCPILYADDDIQVHKKDMQTFGFNEQPLESKVLLYP